LVKKVLFASIYDHFQRQCQRAPYPLSTTWHGIEHRYVSYMTYGTASGAAKKARWFLHSGRCTSWEELRLIQVYQLV
jgi:hypothetical protein